MTEATTEATITGWCRLGECARCPGTLRGGTGWNWWCTCRHHPEPVIKDPAHQPALDFWRKHRQRGEGES